MNGRCDLDFWGDFCVCSAQVQQQLLAALEEAQSAYNSSVQGSGAPGPSSQQPAATASLTPASDSGSHGQAGAGAAAGATTCAGAAAAGAGASSGVGAGAAGSGSGASCFGPGAPDFGPGPGPGSGSGHSINPRMHPSNKYSREEPDFAALAQAYPQLQQYVTVGPGAGPGGGDACVMRGAGRECACMCEGGGGVHAGCRFVSCGSVAVWQCGRVFCYNNC